MDLVALAITKKIFTAVAIDCGSLPNPPNGAVDLSLGTQEGAIALYSCDEDFFLDGNIARQCLDSGSWSGNEPDCIGEVIDIISIKPSKINSFT